MVDTSVLEADVARRGSSSLPWGTILRNVVIYIVLTPGRTGSNLICGMISTLERCPSFPIHQNFEQILNVPDNCVVHTHNKGILDILKKHKSLKQVTLVLSKRINQFDIILSHLVTQKSNEYSVYTGKQIEPFTADISCMSFYRDHLDWYNDSRFLEDQFSKVVTIQYEQLIEEGIVYVSNLLDIKSSIVDYDINKGKSPYNNKELVLNWKELEEIYNSWNITGG